MLLLSPDGQCVRETPHTVCELWPNIWAGAAVVKYLIWVSANICFILRLCLEWQHIDRENRLFALTSPHRLLPIVSYCWPVCCNQHPTYCQLLPTLGISLLLVAEIHQLGQKTFHFVGFTILSGLNLRFLFSLPANIDTVNRYACIKISSNSLKKHYIWECIWLFGCLTV